MPDSLGQSKARKEALQPGVTLSPQPRPLGGNATATTGQGLPTTSLPARRVGNGLRRQDKGEPGLSVAEKTEPAKAHDRWCVPWTTKLNPGRFKMSPHHPSPSWTATQPGQACLVTSP